MQKDDDDWVDLLAGKEVHGASVTTQEEANVLRNAVLTREASVASIDHEGWVRLHARLQAEGLCVPLSENSTQRSYLAFAAAVLLCIGIGFFAPYYWTPHQDESIENMRGVEQAYVIKSKQPTLQAKQLQDELSAFGIALQVTPYPSGVRAEGFIPDEHRSDVEKVLVRFGAKLETDGHLLIEFQRN